MVKKITIDDLAVMVKNGFDKTSTKEQVEKLEYRTNKVEVRLEKVEKKLDKIENLITDDHHKRIEKLESRVDYLENMLALPAKK